MSLRADLHVHSHASPDGLSSLEELTAAGKAAGLDAIAIADHNLCTALPPEQNGVLLIPACEVSTQAGHILGLFLDEPLDLPSLTANGLPTGEAAVAEIRKRGGLAVLAHPYQSPSAAGSRPDFPLDGVEGANARAAFKVKDANEQAAALAAALGLPATGGSDAHSRHEVGNAWTEISCEARTLPELKAAVAAGKCRPVLGRNTPCFRKGLSQLGKARRTGDPLRLAKGLVYLGYCWGKDVFRF